MREQPRPDDGEEVLRYFQAEIDSIPVPEVEATEGAEQAIGLRLTIEDYNEVPEEPLSKIAHTNVLAVTSGGELRWQGQGMYQNSLLARLIYPGNGPKHVLIEGSIYMPLSRMEMLESEECNQLLQEASQTKKMISGITGRGTPSVIVPGVICKDAMPYYRMAQPVSELDFTDDLMKENTLQKPVQGAFISIERSAGTVHTYFVYEKLFVFPAVTALFRKAGEKLFPRFE